MKYLKLYESFIYEDGCLMLELSDHLDWNSILSKIEEEDIYNNEDGLSKSQIPYGLQKNPHITLLYPIEDTNYSIIKKVIDENLPNSYKEGINLKIRSVEVFKSNDYDILHFKIQTNDTLEKFVKSLKSVIPNKCKHKIYKPHITIAYLKKGTADKYIKKESIKINMIDTITYSLKGKDNKYTLSY